MDLVFKEKITSAVGELGINLSDTQVDQFYDYYEILIQWNKVMNLTGITELSDVVYKHFTDSLSLVKVVEGLGEEERSLIDVGTGAGFPGIPLKIVFPKLSVVLLDSLNKRIKFLQEVIEQLNLKEIRAVHGRAEDFGQQKDYREKFDYCVSRAVANTSTLVEYCIPFVKVGGAFIACKSGKIEEEMKKGKKAAEILGGEVECVKQFILNGTDAERDLLVIRKKNKTDRKYPRKAGMPGKEPVGE